MTWAILAILAILMVAVVVLGVVMYVLYQAVKAISEREADKSSNSRGLQKLKPGQPAPYFQGTTLDGMSIDNSHFSGAFGALLFVSPKCPSCIASAMEVEAIDNKAAGNTLLICEGDRIACSEMQSGLNGTHPLILDEAGAIMRTFGVIQTPIAVLIDADGTIERYGSPLREDEVLRTNPERFPGGVRPTFVH